MSDDRPLSSDELALQRTILASERTFMAWTRTALSLISFGFTIPKVLQYSEGQNFRLLGDQGPRLLGTILIALGVLVLAISSYDHWQQVRRMGRTHRVTFAPNRLSYIVSFVLMALGGLALLNLLFRIGPL